MDEDNNPIIKNTGDINIDTTTYFQQETQNITQNGDYIYEQNENGAWHLELKPQDSTEPTDVNINISSPPVEFEQSNITNNGYYLMNKNSTTNKYEPVLSTPSNYNLNINVNSSPTPSKINIKYVGKIGDTPFDISNYNYNNSSSSISVSVPKSKTLIVLTPDYDYNNNSVISISKYDNNDSGAISRYVIGYSYYYIFDPSSLYVYDENQSIINICTFSSNRQYINSYFSKDKFNLILN